MNPSKKEVEEHSNIEVSHHDIGNKMNQNQSSVV